LKVLPLPCERYWLTHPYQKKNRNYYVRKVECQEFCRILTTPLRLAKEFNSENNDSGKNRNAGSIHYSRQADPVLSFDQGINKQDVERPVYKSGQPCNKLHPDRRAKDERITMISIPVISPDPEICTIGFERDG